MALIVLMAAVLGAAALVYRRPRWTGRLTMYVRRDTEPGYQVAGVLVRGRLGRAVVHGQSADPGVLRLPHTTARVNVAARRSWRNASQVELLVRVRLSDSGRYDTVRCPAGGRRMILGLDMRHDPTPVAAAAPAPAGPIPPPPGAPPQVPASYPTAPYPQDGPVPDTPTVVQPFPPAGTTPDQTQTFLLPPISGGPRPRDPRTGDPYSDGEFSGGPETGGPRRWPPT